MNWLSNSYLRSKIWLKAKYEDFKENEMGVSGIVATIILVIVVIGLGVLFRTQITTFITNLFTKATKDAKDGGFTS